LVELARVQAPLLARIALEEQLVELLADRIDDYVFGSLDFLDRLRAQGEIVRSFLVGLEIEIEQLVQGRAVDRDRDELVPHHRSDPMLVRPPISEVRQIVDHLAAVGVENVRSVFVVENAGLVRLVISIAADVRPTIDQQDPRPVLARQPLGKNGAGKTGSDDEIIVAAPGRTSAGPEGRVHSAATSSAGKVVLVPTPSRSAMRPAIRACVVSQLDADSSRTASASQPLCGSLASASAASQESTNSSGVEAI